MDKQKFSVYYMSSTHWDREWYLPFQGFRFYLVNMIDDLVKKMNADDNYPIFTLDGQTIVLEDYEEVAFERVKALKTLIADGRIIVGPWYVMPDEFLVSGESLIMNLMFGDKLAQEWHANVLKYGYVNDIFGHIAQMPQIFAGFNIHGAYLGRGVGNEVPISHFLWQSPDGTKCFTYAGYYGGFARDFVYPNLNKDNFDQSLAEYINCERSKSTIPVILVMDTDDHRFADESTPFVQKRIKELFPEADIKNVPVQEMVSALQLYSEKMPIISGELNNTSKNEVGTLTGNIALVTGCLSSYYSLKQNNDRCQNLLEKTLQPMVVMSDIIGNPIDNNFINLAYKYLLKNQPHDSICGCSIDKTHTDMLYRYNQVYNIADALKFDFLKSTSSDYSETGNEYKLTVFNFEPYRKNKHIVAEIPFEYSFPKIKSKPVPNESLNGFKIFDAEDKEIPYQIVNIKYCDQKRIGFQKSIPVQTYTVSFSYELPAYGICEYKIIPISNRVVYESGIFSNDHHAENQLISLDILPNGELKLLDKRTGMIYSGLNRFIDDGEIGDGWWHMSPKNDLSISSYGSPCTIEKISDGVECVSFKITKEFKLPGLYDEINHGRSNDKKVITIVSTVTVYPDSPNIKISTVFDNSVRDHRIRLLMPTEIISDTYFAGQAFCCIERNTHIPLEHKSYFEAEVPEKNMNGIIGVRNDENVGFAFVSAEGLHEGSVNSNGDIYITLLRSFHKVFMQPNAQMSQQQQELTYNYIFAPLMAEDDYSYLLNIQNTLYNPMLTSVSKVKCNAVLQKPISFVKLSNEKISISVIKKNKNDVDYIIRLFNPSKALQETEIEFGFDVDRVFLVNLNEEYLQEVEYQNNRINLAVEPWKIISLSIIPKIG